MRKFIITYILTFITTFSSAQYNSSHLTFNGIPIDGTYDEFIFKLIEAGYEYCGKEKELAAFSCDFAGIKDCSIAVKEPKPHYKVSTVGVAFPDQFEWDSLETRYRYLKSTLTKEYGEPFECAENFFGYTPLTSEEKIYLLRTDKCNWSSTYKTEKGTIWLSIQHLGNTSYYIAIIYYDKINTEEEEAYKDKY